MKALCWMGKQKVNVERVPDPTLINPRDSIIRVTSTAICGSDLHLYNGYIKTMEEGDILGHEFMGEVVDVGPEVKNLRPGDRVVVPCAVACGQCLFCQQELWSLCDNTNPNGWMAEKALGYAGSGFFGYSHAFGGYAGGQAEFVRVPMSNVGPLKVPEGIDDERLLFLGDILSTGYMAAEKANIKQGDIVAVWGCGPVGQFVIRSALLLGAERVIAIDRFAPRLALAEKGGAETLDYEHTDIEEELKERTGGRGPDICIDAVGMEAHGFTADARYDKVKQAMKMETDRPHVLRQAIKVCRKGGTVSIAGVYSGVVDKFPIGVAFNKGLTFVMGQVNVHHYMRKLLPLVAEGKLDPSEIISHNVALEDGPEAYRLFNEKEDNAIKFVLKPGAPRVLTAEES
jgi:threonine dehydrogenase-like Zn-dependent dehydrogenase